MAIHTETVIDQMQSDCMRRNHLTHQNVQYMSTQLELKEHDYARAYYDVQLNNKFLLFEQDDIGSPLMCKDQSGAWYIQGLASSGGDCTKADEPGVFEDVSQYSDWIKQTMRDANYPYQY